MIRTKLILHNRQKYTLDYYLSSKMTKIYKNMQYHYDDVFLLIHLLKLN